MKDAYDALKDALSKCAMENQSLGKIKKSTDDIDAADKEDVEDNLTCDIPLLDPHVSKTKGAPLRMKKGIEKKKKNKKQKKLSCNSKKVCYILVY